MSNLGQNDKKYQTATQARRERRVKTEAESPVVLLKPPIIKAKTPKPKKKKQKASKTKKK